jgi:transposase
VQEIVHTIINAPSTRKRVLLAISLKAASIAIATYLLWKVISKGYSKTYNSIEPVSSKLKRAKNTKTILITYSGGGNVNYSISTNFVVSFVGTLSSISGDVFIDENINGRYRNHLIIIDNAGAHRKQEVKDVIRNGGNELLYTIPYTPKTNAIENWFSQLKHYLKKDGVLSFDLLKQSVRNAIRKIKPENYVNYFRFAYRKEELRKYEKKKSTRYRSPKSYK